MEKTQKNHKDKKGNYVFLPDCRYIHLKKGNDDCNGGTICYMEKRGYVDFSLAICSKKDQFSKEEGRVVSNRKLKRHCLTVQTVLENDKDIYVLIRKELKELVLDFDNDFTQRSALQNDIIKINKLMHDY